ncbi:Transcription factor spt8 [Dipsacomyces acuminosporus]|nr:Transcription factor spt8 [Dipsacomyces acuminosporus]
MSDNGFNDDLLERELFGGDSDDLDGANMDVDDMLGMDESTAGLGSAVGAGADTHNVNAGDARPAEGERQKERSLPTLDIEMDDPPGELTIFMHPPRARADIADGYSKCKSYDIVPTISMINPYQIHAIAATSNTRWVFTGGEDGYIKKWDFNATVNGRQMLTQGQRHSHVDSVVKAGVMASYWDHNDPIEGGNEALSPVYSMDVHSEAMWLVSGMKSGHIALWSVRHDEGRRIALLTKHKKPVSVLRISPDEFGLVSGSWDRAVLYWDLNTGKVARGFAGHLSQISSAEFRPAWTYEKYKSLPQNAAVEASAGGSDADEQAARPFNAQTSSPILMTTSIDGQCMLWDVRAPKALPHGFETPKKTPPWATSACWSPDGKRIYVGRRNNTVDEYEFGMDTQPVRTLRLPMNSGPVTALAAMPNGASLVCASTDNIRMWDLAQSSDKRSAVPFQIIPGSHGSTISNILVDESSRYMITTSGNRGWDGSSNNNCLAYEIGCIS